MAIGVLLIGGVFFVRASAQGTANGALTSVQATGTPGGVTVGNAGDPSRDVLFLLNRLSSIKIDKAIFESRAFNSLQDFGLKVVDEAYGRPNPFAPIGNDVSLPITETNSISPVFVPTTPSPSPIPSASVKPSPSPKKSTPASTPANTGNGFDDGSGFFDPTL